MNHRNRFESYLMGAGIAFMCSASLPGQAGLYLGVVLVIAAIAIRFYSSSSS